MNARPSPLLSAVLAATPLQACGGGGSAAGRPLKRLFKLDPGFPWDARNRSRIQLLTVCASTHRNNPAYAQPMRDAVAALDLSRLATLLN